jgi:hypothetical protein
MMDQHKWEAHLFGGGSHSLRHVRTHRTDALIQQNLTIRTAVRFKSIRQAAFSTWATAIYD